MRHILLADPDAEERKRLRAIVERIDKKDLTVHEAEDGAKAFDLVRQHPMAVIVCEIVMDTMSGLQLLRRVQGDRPHGEPPPVIFVTSMSREIDRYWGLRNGAHAYLAKPYEESRLQDRIEKALAGGPQASPERLA